MPIYISRTSTGLLIQRDEVDIVIDQSAIPAALPAIIASLVDSSRAIGAARQDGYEAGLIVGHANGTREAEQRYLREAQEIAAGLALLKVSAPLAA